jgi:hypothetical protein
MTYDTAPYKQGVGFSYRESFNSFRDLFYPPRKKKLIGIKTSEDIPSK